MFWNCSNGKELVKRRLRIVAADSGAAVLNEYFEPIQVVAACAVLVEPPYKEAAAVLAEPIFSKVENGHELVVHELELCMNLLKSVKADVVHLDMSFGGLSVEELSPLSLSQTHLGAKARGHVLRVLPKLRKTALDIRRTYDIDVLAIGKESVPVRIAELTAGAHAILYSAEKVMKETKTTLLGLPAKCSMRPRDREMVLESSLPAEHDITGRSPDESSVLQKVHFFEMPNPCARGFRLLEITPRI